MPSFRMTLHPRGHGISRGDYADRLSGEVLSTNGHSFSVQSNAINVRRSVLIH